MTKFILKNQKLIKSDEAFISIDDRSFLFGDGIFETCKIFAGKIYDFKSHKARIKKGLKSLEISAKIDDLEEKSLKLIKKNKIQNGILRILISRGQGSLGYLPSKKKQSLIIIQTLEERYLPKKISLHISDIKINSNNQFLTNCKTNNALPYILTKIKACNQGFFDGIITSGQNVVLETSSANIFWVKNGKIYTPKADLGMLCGTVRKKLLEISPLKIFEKKAKIDELKTADEVFLTNSSFLVLGVDEIKFKNGELKKLSKAMSKTFLKLMLEDVKKDCV